MSNTYEIYLVSDSTGETLDRIFLALKAQFNKIIYKKHQFSFIRTENQVLKIVDVCKKKKNSIILYTIVDTKLAKFLNTKSEKEKIPCFGVLGGLILIPISSGQIIAIAVAGITGLVWRRQFSSSEVSQTSVMDSLTFATGNLLLLVVLLVGLPVLTLVTGVPTLIDVMDGLFRSGALVFGGGHVVLPLLEAEFVATGWVDRDVFFAGYGIMQALPGPIFAFAGYLGTVMSPVPNGLLGGGICLAALFLPGLFLIWGVLPFWPRF